MLNTIIHPKVSVGVIVMSPDNKLLLSKRKDCGQFGLPGGNLELFEEIEDCGKRELEEETGLRVTHMSQFTVLNLIYREKNFHCVLFVMLPRTMEPDKHEEWIWFDAQQLQAMKEQSIIFNGLQELTKDGAQTLFEMINQMIPIIHTNST